MSIHIPEQFSSLTKLLENSHFTRDLVGTPIHHGPTNGYHLEPSMPTSASRACIVSYSEATGWNAIHGKSADFDEITKLPAGGVGLQTCALGSKEQMLFWIEAFFRN